MLSNTFFKVGQRREELSRGHSQKEQLYGQRQQDGSPKELTLLLEERPHNFYSIGFDNYATTNCCIFPLSLQNTKCIFLLLLHHCTSGMVTGWMISCLLFYILVNQEKLQQSPAKRTGTTQRSQTLMQMQYWCLSLIERVAVLCRGESHQGYTLRQVCMNEQRNMGGQRGRPWRSHQTVLPSSSE